MTKKVTSKQTLRSKIVSLTVMSFTMYEWAVRQLLFTRNFQRAEDSKGLKDVKEGHPRDAEKRFILEVDLECHQEMHEACKAYPLAPERVVIEKVCMSVSTTFLVLVWH